MEDIFIKILNMSITASYFALAVIVIRLIFKRTPKWITCILWGLVGLRLILPFSFESILSLIPSSETVPSDIMFSKTPHISSGIPAFNSVINPVIEESFAPVPYESANPLQIIVFILSVIWFIGIAAMLIYTAVSYFMLKRKTAESIKTENGIYICDTIDTPFILGVIKPKIYIPSETVEADIEFITAHEKAHIKRGDHLWKPLGFLILSVYWFNPLMWIAYVLLCRDIEAACDEKVIKDMGTDIKKSYSEALINCSAPKRLVSACPLAFGETGVKGRIKNVLNYKKPTLWIIIFALIISVILSVCFMTNPRGTRINDIPEYEDIFKNVEKLQFKLHPSYTYTTEDPWDELRVLKKVKIDDTAVSDDRSTNRDSTYKVEINDKNSIYINDSFTELWLDDKQSVNFNINLTGSSEMNIDDGKLPSPSYKIQNPEILKKLFDEIYTPTSPIIGTETSPLFTDFEGVYLTLKSIDTNAGGYKVFNLIWNNTTDTEITYGEFYDIEIKNGEEWESVATEDIVFTTIGYILKAGEAKHKEYTTQRFDISKIGTYRLISYFSAGDGNHYETYIEFQIKNDGGDISDIGGVSGPEAIITTKQLTLDDVIRLSKKGKDLSWEDFEEFSYIETGSGLYIRAYKIDGRFSLTIGGTGTDIKPMYIYLSSPIGLRIDIRADDVELFIEENKDIPIPEPGLSFGSRIFPVDSTGNNLSEIMKYGAYPPKHYDHMKTFPTVRIDNLKELESFYGHFENKLDFNLTFEDVGFTFSQIKTIYGNEFKPDFFDEHCLLIIYATASNKLNRFDVQRLQTDGETLYINIRESVYEDTENSTPTGWFIVVEAYKAHLTNIKNIEARVGETLDLPEPEITHTYTEINDSGSPFNRCLFLYDDGTFALSVSPYSSYVAYGNFEYEGDLLILTTDDGIYRYVFEVNTDSVTYKAEQSVVYRLFTEVPDGTKFMLL